MEGIRPQKNKPSAGRKVANCKRQKSDLLQYPHSGTICWCTGGSAATFLSRRHFSRLKSEQGDVKKKKKVKSPDDGHC